MDHVVAAAAAGGGVHAAVVVDAGPNGRLSTFAKHWIAGRRWTMIMIHHGRVANCEQWWSHCRLHSLGFGHSTTRHIFHRIQIHCLFQEGQCL